MIANLKHVDEQEELAGGVAPDAAGASLKPPHYEAVLRSKAECDWFEVHAENYFGEGGPPHHYLSRIRESYPLSVHGVGLSLGGADRPDQSHLLKLRGMLERYEPWVFSEHLAWSSHEDVYLNDLLPISYTDEVLDRVASHVAEVQDILGRRILIENPSTYLSFEDTVLSEVDFLGALCRQTGCGLLLDVTNVEVSSRARGSAPLDYLDALDGSLVEQIHLAGHALERGPSGEASLAIDTHDRPVSPGVWALYRHFVEAWGHRPTLIEWDRDFPPLATLEAEARLARNIMAQAGGSDAA